jgi:hypothetical protein
MKYFLFTSLILIGMQINGFSQSVGSDKENLLLSATVQVPGTSINTVRLVDSGGYESMYSFALGVSTGFRIQLLNNVYLEPEISISHLNFNGGNGEYKKGINFIDRNIGLPINFSKKEEYTFFWGPGAGYTSSFYSDNIGDFTHSISGFNIYSHFSWSKRNSIEFGFRTSAVYSDYGNEGDVGSIWYIMDIVNEFRISYKLF